MPIRTASLTTQIRKNGARLHLAMASRIQSRGAEQPPSDQEQALLEERRALKAAQAKRQGQPRTKPKAVVKAPKPPKAAKAPKEPKPPKAPKEAKAAKATADNKPSRADKLAKKAQNLEASRKADKKSAKT
jgi:hypothetical protein